MKAAQDQSPTKKIIILKTWNEARGVLSGIFSFGRTKASSSRSLLSVSPTTTLKKWVGTATLFGPMTWYLKRVKNIAKKTQNKFLLICCYTIISQFSTVIIGIKNWSNIFSGPLVATVANQVTLVGVTSFGNGCAKSPFPGVYARVTAQLPWILANTDAGACQN